jgi:hypothetical protein
MIINLQLDIKLDDVDYTYHERIPAVMYEKDGSGSPEEASHCEVRAVWKSFNENPVTNIIELFDYDELEKLVTEEHERTHNETD